MTNKVNPTTSLTGQSMEVAMQDGILDKMEQPVSVEALQRRITELEEQVYELKRGIGLAKILFKQAAPTKAEEMLDAALRKAT